MPEMLEARESHSSLVFGHEVYVFCGHDGERNLNTVEFLDLAPRQGYLMTKS